MTFMARLRTARGSDSGAALMTVLMAGAVLTASALVAVNVSLTNLKNAGRDRVASGAMGAAEGGLAEAVSYLQTQNAGVLSCSPTCATNPWGNSTTPKSMTYPDGGVAKVWIEVIQKFQPPNFKVATYKIHSKGTAGNGPGQRTLEQTVTGKPLAIPIGVYATNITVNGNPSTFKESVFSKNCISGRDKMNFGTDPDAYFGIPPAAHSTQWISEKNGSCAATNGQNIHKAGACNTPYVYDQDAQGGPISSPCSAPGNTSLFTQADLDGYGRGLNDDELANLRSQAQSMGQYWTSTTWTPPNPAVNPHAVIFFDLPASGTVTLQNELDAYTWDGECTSAPQTVILVVNNASKGTGGVQFNSNNTIAGALFVQKGYLQFNGGVNWTGTIWADTIEKWNGNAESQLTQCYLDNLPGGLMTIKLTRFREVDR
jgi:hypothetical protein